MILKGKMQDEKTVMAVGQICFLIGLLGSRLAERGGLHDAAGWVYGLVQGLTTALLAASIYFNVRGLVLHRRGRN